MNKNFYNKRMGMDVNFDQMPFPVSVSQKVSNVFHCDIKDTLENLSDVSSILMALRMAEETDEVIVYLNCLGGSASVLDSVLDSMSKCLAPIHVEASGTVASAATFIILNADSFEVSQGCEFMFHGASYASMGHMTTVKNHVDFTHRQTEKLLRTHYKGFFSEDEITKLIDEKVDWYMDAEEFITRFNKRNELLAAEQDTCDCEECTGCDDDDEPLTEEEEEELYKALEGLKHKIKDKDAM